ncbi:MAG: phosphoadenosine phosphosulfate reductase family protein [Oscillospiraceae bacterium]|nr:phosphoadenosine phosphosulfate reductase family protein [Oscillospiraceae bacterium]
MNYNVERKRCKCCVLPETEGYIPLNENGLCPICTKHRQLEEKGGGIDGLSPEARLDLLKKKVARFTKDAGKYDCAVSVSGGKDSIMTLYIAKEILHLKPLAVFIDNGFALEEMYHNVRNATDVLGVDLVVFKTADVLDIFQKCLQSGKKIYYCRVCHALIDKAVRDVCRQNGIRLVLGGYTKGQQYIRNFELFWIYEESDRNIIDILSQDDKYAELTEMYSNQPKYFREHYGDIVQLSPFKYIEWNEGEILSLITEKLGFTLPKRSWPDKSSNCSFNYVAQYLAMKQFGYAQHETELSDMVRAGELSRQRALEIISTPIEDTDLIPPLAKMGYSLSDILK